MLFLGRDWCSVVVGVGCAMSRLLGRRMQGSVRMRSYWLAWLNKHILVADGISWKRMFTIFGGSKNPEEIRAIVMLEI